jgi:hypothetical protein
VHVEREGSESDAFLSRLGGAEPEEPEV